MGIAAAGAPTLLAADAQTAVPVKKVVLFSSGVGYFEHAGAVDGDATSELRFTSNQINDILKSLVLEDLDGGLVGSVVYPSLDPLSKTLGSFQVDISKDPSLGELLDQLRGSNVSVEIPGEKFTGVLLGAETKTLVNEKGSVLETHWWINVLEGGVIRSTKLEEVRKIEMLDPQLRDELNKALQAVSQARDQDKKPVTVHFNGQGHRRVRLGYVVETPIWKTTYRLIMPEGDSLKGKLQGWAIVENQTESDWNDVSLALVSGRPISFIQNLYQPLYINRPVVVPELFAGLMPPTYEDGMDREEQRAGGFGGSGGGFGGGGYMGRRGMMPKAAPQATFAEEMPFSDSGGDADGLIDAFSSVAAMATTAAVGELFQYTVPNVSLPRQRSAMIPIVTEDIGVERVSIYNASVLPKNPLNGAMLTNTTGKQLLQGPVTVLDDHSYAGDARIDDLPKGQKRLLSYAVDMDVRVNAEQQREESSLQTGKLVKGVLQLRHKHVFRQEYAIENRADKSKTILVEHPLRPGWDLVDSPNPFEKTETLYRFREVIDAGGEAKLSVTQERVSGETIALLPADVTQIAFYAQSNQLPPKVRTALEKAIEHKQAMAETELQIKQREQIVRNITDEQERIRSNMKTVNQSSEYYTRLLTKLDEQETEIEKHQQQIDELRDQYNKQRNELTKYLSDLDIE
jgi:hypothetical protein